jgi:hypothetical protein
MFLVNFFKNIFVKREYRIFQRFHRYRGWSDRLFMTTSNKKSAEIISEYLTKKGVSEDGRRDYEGIVT